MHYTPHILQVYTTPNEAVDEYGRPIPGDASEWMDVCPCRCDHNGDREVRLSDGKVVVPEFHIVVEHLPNQVKVGTRIRAVNKDRSIRGEGIVMKTKTLNFLPYAEIYM